MINNYWEKIMLRLDSITKSFGSKEQEVKVLKGISLQFRDREFVSILGQSGCGKTTLLNLLGGLDKATSGSLFVNGVSTDDFLEKDWNDYRNKQVGFVFQTYNLIPHQSVISNVELPLVLSGVNKEERKARAQSALEKVGLADQAKKRPMQLSGGQMQRVAIARALVNNPSVIFADEPTGALDSVSGKQVMEILKEIAKDRLVIMVTHNDQLANEYSTRIISMNDGTIINDSNPYAYDECITDEQQYIAKRNKEEESQKASIVADSNKKAQKIYKKQKRKKRRETSMSFATANSLSINNLRSKKGRTILTSIAGSIGIIGIMLVLALSGGVEAYINTIEENALSQYPLTIEETNTNLTAVMQLLGSSDVDREENPDSEVIYTQQVLGNLLENLNSVMSKNDLEKFKEYTENNFDESIGYVKYDYGVEFDVFCNYVDDDERYMKVNPFLEAIENVMPGGFSDYSDMIAQFGSMLSVWDEMVDNDTLLSQQYELLGNSRWPTAYNEVVVVVDNKNQLSDYTLFALGLVPASDIVGAIFQGGEFAETTYTVDDILSIEYRLTTGADYCIQNQDGSWTQLTDRNEQRKINFVESHSVPVKVVGVIRPKEGVEVTSIMGTIGYTSELKQYLSQRAENSAIVKAQKENTTINVITGEEINEEQYKELMRSYGVADFDKPTSISFYANSFEDKDKIVAFIDEYNQTTDSDIKYNDNLAMIMDFVDTLTATITKVLAGFAGISLIVSSIMIAIIIYTSVLERKKEIGVLRSIGARKRDVSNVFLAESCWIGALSGVIGILISFALVIVVNIVLNAVLGIANLAVVAWWQPVAMFVLSVGLAVIAGLIPSRIASNKNPVECLRSE